MDHVAIERGGWLLVETTLIEPFPTGQLNSVYAIKALFRCIWGSGGEAFKPDPLLCRSLLCLSQLLAVVSRSST